MNSLPLVIIKLLKPAAVQLPTTPDDPLRASQSHPSSSAKSSYSPKFDLNLARISVVIDILASLVQLFASNSPVFLCGSVLGALGSGFSPAVHAFALDLYSKRGGNGQAGRLFGAISVVQALG